MDEAMEKHWRELSKEVQIGMEEWRQHHPNATLREIGEAVHEQLTRLRPEMVEAWTGMFSQVDWSQPRWKWTRVRYRSSENTRISSKKPEKTDGFPLRDAFSLPLWERIRAWCQYVNWYGPDWLTEASP